MQEAIIEVEHLCKGYKVGKEDISILKDLNFSVYKEDFLSIMGPSGCGKSTLLYLLGGLDKPTSGSIKIKNRDLGKLKEKEKSIIRRRDIGFVFQFYNLVPNLSVEDNILLPVILDKRNLKKYNQKLNDILEVIEMTNKRKNTPRELSGGQQQRVAIARALIFEPEIILADEPIGNLDSKTGTEIMKLFSDINKSFHTTIVQVTHSVESSYYGNRTIFLKDGVVLSDKIILDEERKLKLNQ